MQYGDWCCEPSIIERIFHAKTMLVRPNSGKTYGEGIFNPFPDLMEPYKMKKRDWKSLLPIHVLKSLDWKVSQPITNTVALSGASVIVRNRKRKSLGFSAERSILGGKRRHGEIIYHWRKKWTGVMPKSTRLPMTRSPGVTETSGQAAGWQKF